MDHLFIENELPAGATPPIVVEGTVRQFFPELERVEAVPLPAASAD